MVEIFVDDVDCRLAEIRNDEAVAPRQALEAFGQVAIGWQKLI